MKAEQEKLAAELQRVPLEMLRAEIMRRGRGIPAEALAVIHAVADAFGLAPELLFYMNGRPDWITKPRQAAMVLMRRAGLGWQVIADVFQVNHSTCIYAANTQKERMNERGYQAKFKEAEAVLLAFS